MSVVKLVKQWINDNVDVPAEKLLWVYNNVETPKEWYLLADVTQVYYNRVSEYAIQEDVVVELTLTVFEDADERRLQALHDRILEGLDLIYATELYAVEGNAEFVGSVKSVAVSPEYLTEQHSRVISVHFTVAETKL